MLRYFKLYTYFLQFSFSRAMEFRIDFFFRIGMDLVYYIVSFLFYQVIFHHTPLFGGWNENQMIVFVAGTLLVDALNMTLFANNMWWLPHFVNTGELDYYLTRPVSSLFFLTLREFSANSFVNLLITFGIFIWALIQYEGVFSLGNTLIFFLLLINGTFLYCILQLLFILPVFWTHSARGFQTVFWNMHQFLEKPHRIYTGWARLTLTYFLPFALMTSFPAKLFLEGFDLSIFLRIILISLLFFGLLLCVWRLALRSYSSASS